MQLTLIGDHFKHHINAKSANEFVFKVCSAYLKRHPFQSAGSKPFFCKCLGDAWAT